MVQSTYLIWSFCISNYLFSKTEVKKLKPQISTQHRSSRSVHIAVCNQLAMLQKVFPGSELRKPEDLPCSRNISSAVFPTIMWSNGLVLKNTYGIIILWQCVIQLFLKTKQSKATNKGRGKERPKDYSW